jgi:hypothetical protein
LAPAPEPLDLEPQSEVKRQPVKVDGEVCARLATLLRSRKIPPDAEERKPDVPADLVGNFFLALVAICHQTSPMKGRPLQGLIEGRVRRGWDYLWARFEAAAQAAPEILEPADWCEFRAPQLGEVFHDEKYGDRLTDHEGRAALLRDLGAHMLAWGWRRVDALYHHCEGRVAAGQPNLLGMLARLRAFGDPLRKKSLLFLSLMRNTHTWQYEDDESLGPPVDYHEVRGHLRLGTVRVTSRELEEKLRRGIPVTAREDQAIRAAVYDAIMVLSQESDLRNPSQLHYLFWNVFRAVCRRRSPQCLRIGPRTKLPRRYLPLTVHEAGNRCPFSSVCASAEINDRYVEHVFATDYY